MKVTWRVALVQVAVVFRWASLATGAGKAGRAPPDYLRK
jgi:hypothetical protein